MQAFAPFLTSLSGFLGTLTSLLEVIIDESEVPVYQGISAAAYSRDQSSCGTYFGLWFKHAWNIELQDAVIQEQTVIYGTMSNGGLL